MLDVHAPHSKIEGIKEFLLHLFTISVGLLIAVGIEGCVERYHHTELAKEARETMRVEIEKNKVTMTDALKTIADEQATMVKNVENIKKIQLHPESQEAQHSSLSGNYSIVSLRNTSFHTAQATGALAYMPYTEAERYSEIYGEQQEFLERQAKIEEDSAEFFGLIRQYHVGDGKISREAGDAIAHRFGIWQGHLLQLDIAAKVLQDEQASFLEGREAKTSLEEKMHN